jgi:hypothetical protein
LPCAGATVAAVAGGRAALLATGGRVKASYAPRAVRGPRRREVLLLSASG